MTHELTDEREAFEAWYDEIENFATRGERLAELGWREAMYAAWQAALLAHLAQRGTSPDLRAMLVKARAGLSNGLWDYGPGQDEHEQCDALIAEIDAALAASPQAQPMPDGGKGTPAPDAWALADAAIADAYPDVDSKGPGWWGQQRIPNWGILRGAIVRAIAATSGVKEGGNAS